MIVRAWAVPGSLLAALAMGVFPICLLAIPASAQDSVTPAPAAQAIEGYALIPGDVVRLTISREADMSGEYPVDETGNLALPLVGLIPVTDVPPAELKRRILAGYEEQLRNQTVQVALLRRVTVLGAVNQPGLYHVDPTMTLAQTVALAGGPSGVGRMDDVRIIRDGRELDTELTATTMAQVRSGDQIVVKQTSWWSRNNRYIIGASIGIVGLLIRETVR